MDTLSNSLMWKMFAGENNCNQYVACIRIGESRIPAGPRSEMGRVVPRRQQKHGYDGPSD
jgi:hypothetical protein